MSPLAAFALAGTLVPVLNGCGGSGTPGTAPFLPLPPPQKGKYFTHIVILVQENRTFDNLFATFPGADGTSIGKTHNGTRRLRESDLYSPINPRNYYLYWKQDCNGDASAQCRMNGFDTVPIGKTPGTYVYQYVNPAQIKPYWDMAHQYVLADHFFQTQGSGSFTAHQDLIRGGTELNSSQSLIDLPSHQPWGCDAPPGTVTSLISPTNRYDAGGGPFPCLSYRTLRDLLDGAKVSWRYYSPAVGLPSGDVWAAFDAIKAVRFGPEWSTNQASPETKAFTDIDRDTLPGVSWIIPDFDNSDHAGRSGDTGPSWVAQVVNAIGESPAWNTTAIFILWDDWGGWYDHVPPPGPHRSGGLGFRVPLIAISPFAKAGYISHGQYQFGSIVRFVEDNWSLGRLQTTDATSSDFANDFFDFTQKPRRFHRIAARYSKAYFLRQAPSNKPVDDE
ncbi:MAG: alkaline phosphatase family protein [Candidatus Cybelea sp.]